MQLRLALLAVLLGSVVGAAAATKSAGRQLSSTVGGRNDPEVRLCTVLQSAPQRRPHSIAYITRAPGICTYALVPVRAHDSSTSPANMHVAHLFATSCSDAVLPVMSQGHLPLMRHTCCEGGRSAQGLREAV